MPPVVESVFEFLFKYRPVVFEKGDFSLAAPGVAFVVALAAVFAGVAVQEFPPRAAARNADADAFQILPVGDLDRLGQLNGRRVAPIPARHDAVEQRVVADRLRHRADLVEARRERDDPVARNGSVCRT